MTSRKINTNDLPEHIGSNITTIMNVAEDHPTIEQMVGNLTLGGAYPPWMIFKGYDFKLMIAFASDLAAIGYPCVVQNGQLTKCYYLTVYFE